jgi:CRISPR-associated protein Csd1
MLGELVQAAERFASEPDFLPGIYSYKEPRWVVNLADGRAYLEGPYSKGEIRAWLVPDQWRSGSASKGNVKPRLLIDDVRFVFGKPESASEEDVRDAELMHSAYVDLLEEAWRSTGVAELEEVLRFVQGPEAASVAERIRPRDLIAFAVRGRNPAAIPEVREFWLRYLSRELALDAAAACPVCGSEARGVRYLPRPVEVLGQRCQIVSFNEAAFCSFGKKQNANAPLCLDCAVKVIGALDYLVRAERHHRVLVGDTKEPSSENQLAVFWLKEPVVNRVGQRVYDLQDLVGAVLEEVPRERTGPPPRLAQLEAMLAVPWTAREDALNLAGNRFYLAVLSANKARLVVRGWLAISVEKLRENLAAFLQATRLVDPEGTGCGPQSVPSIVGGIGRDRSPLTGYLVRTAFEGLRPPDAMLEAAVVRFRVLAGRRDVEGQLYSVAAAVKLCLTHRREEARRMEVLDPDRKTAAYLCGRLLAVLEEAQRRASGSQLGSAVAERFYGAASAAPAATLPVLLSRAQSSHLPKIRRENRGYAAVERLLAEILTGVDGSGGFPRVLSLPEQADFALGFYHQRAAFRAERARASGGNQN